MGVVKGLPFKDLLFLQERLSSIFDEALAKYGGLDNFAQCAWIPPTDIYETEDHIVLKLELPGVKLEDVSVEIKDNTLILKESGPPQSKPRATVARKNSLTSRKKP